MELSLFNPLRGKNGTVELVKDSVCGMEIDLANAYRTELGGKIYYFCGAACKASFKKAHVNVHAHAIPNNVRKVSRRNAGCCH